jgi:hypothetical protein
MATYPINFDFKVLPEFSGFSLLLAPFLISGEPGEFTVRIELPSGKILRSNTEGGAVITGLPETGYTIYAKHSITLAQINTNWQNSGSVKDASGNAVAALADDFKDGLFKVSVSFSTSTDEYENTRFFILVPETKQLLLNKLKEVHRTYPQIPYSVMYAGGEKRAMRSLMLLQAAELEIEKENIDQARLLVSTVVRFVKTWLTV